MSYFNTNFQTVVSVFSPQPTVILALILDPASIPGNRGTVLDRWPFLFYEGEGDAGPSISRIVHRPHPHYKGTATGLISIVHCQYCMPCSRFLWRKLVDKGTRVCWCRDEDGICLMSWERVVGVCFTVRSFKFCFCLPILHRHPVHPTSIHVLQVGYAPWPSTGMELH